VRADPENAYAGEIGEILFGELNEARAQLDI
jgi:hypothetical protein